MGAEQALVLRRGVALVSAAVAAGATLLVWWFFVTTAPGQRLDQVAYDGSRHGRWRLLDSAHAVLEVVSVPFLLIALLAAGAVALLRGRGVLAVGAALVIGGANLTTQILKYELLSRPDLGVGEQLANSLPSGHTTVAGSVACAALLVAPTAWRGAVAVGGAGYTGATGVATMVGGWHRASDVVAAVLVVSAWGLLVQALVPPSAPEGAARPPWTWRPDRRGARRPRRGGPTALALAAVASAIVALVALAATLAAPGHGRTAELVAYAGASAGVVAVTCAAFLGMLAAGARPAPGGR